jgi:hypothetical protein
VADQAHGGNCFGSPTDAGYNLSSGTSCGFGSGTASHDSATLDLGVLAANGGPTETVALLGTTSSDQALGAITSPATVSLGGSTVELCSDRSYATASGYVASLATDQRGVSRLATGCDAGAYQVAQSAPPPVPLAPVVTTVNPSSGPLAGSTSVTIEGENLLGAAYVLFGSAEAKSFEVLSPTEITALSPPGSAAGRVAVSVITPGGTSVESSGDSFTYLSPSPPAPPGPGYHPITPTRICDTRPGNPSGLSGEALANCEGKAPGPGSVLTIDVAGLAGIPADATAVALDLVAVDPTASGYLTAYPADELPPGTSSVDYTAGQSVANQVIVALPTGDAYGGAYDGSVAIYNHSASSRTNVVVDVEGWVGPESTPGTGLYVPLSPARICDTMTSAPANPCSGDAPAAGGTLSFPVAGQGGVPSSGVAGVMATITAIDPSSAGYLTAYPAGGSLPVVSELDYAPGATTSNSLILPLGAGGEVSVYSNVGSPQVTLDVEGYITDSSNPSATGSVLVGAATPVRICDTRAGNPSGLSGAALANCEGKTLSAKSTLDVQATGLAGLPADATGVIVNITATDTTASSYLTAAPAGTTSTAQAAGATQPVTPVLAWAQGETVSGLAIVPVGTGGQISLYNDSGSADLIVDVVGWAVPSGT